MAEFSLMLSAFLAATLFPFSSEAALIVALKNGVQPLHALFFASFGNILAIILNYALGYFLYEKTKTKLFRSKTGRTLYIYGHRYGYVTLFVSWLPIIGDPLTIVAGLLRLNFVWFVIIAGSLRVARYLFVASMM